MDLEIPSEMITTWKRYLRTAATIALVTTNYEDTTSNEDELGHSRLNKMSVLTFPDIYYISAFDIISYGGEVWSRLPRWWQRWSRKLLYNKYMKKWRLEFCQFQPYTAPDNVIRSYFAKSRFAKSVDHNQDGKPMSPNVWEDVSSKNISAR